MSDQGADRYFALDQSYKLNAIAHYLKAITLAAFGFVGLTLGGATAFIVGLAQGDGALAAIAVGAGGVVAAVAWILAWDAYSAANRNLALQPNAAQPGGTSQAQ